MPDIPPPTANARATAPETDRLGVPGNQRALIKALLEPAAYPHPVGKISLLETHISYVLLTGRFAYKIKKSVNLGFLDFSTLEQRRFFCEEELRLNSRFEPGLYLEVIPLGLVPGGVQVGATERIVDYAVKMHEFPQTALLDRWVAEDRLRAAQIDKLADRIAVFHRQAAHAQAGDAYGSPPAVWQPIGRCLGQLRKTLAATKPEGSELTLLGEIKIWCREEYARLKPFLARRRHDGFVRECHGDLHLGNIIWLDDAPALFDCIEFNAKLRWIDVMNDLAFLVMDLEEKGKPELAYRLLNRYLEATGDYAGLQVLPLYCVYRALVRAMVSALRAMQESPGATTAEMASCQRYLTYAQNISRPQKTWLVLMHGLSGSGKTTISQRVIEGAGAIRLRSDIERKRMSGIPALAHHGDALASGLYDETKTQATYARLTELAHQVLAAGFPVLVDSANLKTWQREIFYRLAGTLGVPWHVLSCQIDESPLRQRLIRRAQDGGDASDATLAVLEHQQQSADPLTETEQEKASPVHDANTALELIRRWIVARNRPEPRRTVDAAHHPPAAATIK